MRRESYELPVKAWGSGIRRIISAAGEYGLPVLTVEVYDDMFRANLYRNVQGNVNGGEKGRINKLTDYDKIKFLGGKNVVLYILFNRLFVKWSLLWVQSFFTEFLY